VIYEYSNRDDDISVEVSGDHILIEVYAEYASYGSVSLPRDEAAKLHAALGKALGIDRP
jgi:hypothetical protein